MTLRPLAGQQKEIAMRTTTALSACATVAMLACTSENGPTEPEAGTIVPTVTTEAAVEDTWQERAHRLSTAIGVAVGVMPNSAGQSVVYTFGGCDVVQGGGSNCTVSRIGIYNAVTGTQTGEMHLK
jgi:hypothetical protein